MEEAAGDPFPDSVVQAVRRHMNEDHLADSLLICRVIGGVPEATGATVASFDGQGIDFAVVVGPTTRQLRIPWSGPISERGQVRAELVRLTEAARRGEAPVQP